MALLTVLRALAMAALSHHPPQPRPRPGQHATFYLLAVLATHLPAEHQLGPGNDVQLFRDLLMESGVQTFVF